MKRAEVAGAIVWGAIGVVICAAAAALRLGSWQRPEPGLFPFLIGSGIVLLSVVQAVSQFLIIGDRAERGRIGDVRRVGIVVLLLGGYALALERVGFLVCTVLFFVVLFRTLGSRGWGYAIGAGVLGTLLAYALFDVWLRVNLPRGPLGL